MSEALREHYKTHVSPLKGRKLSDERKREISLSHMGIRPTLESRRRMSQAVTDWWSKPGTRERMSKSKKRYWNRLKRYDKKRYEEVIKHMHEGRKKEDQKQV